MFAGLNHSKLSACRLLDKVVSFNVFKLCAEKLVLLPKAQKFVIERGGWIVKSNFGVN